MSRVQTTSTPTSSSARSAKITYFRNPKMANFLLFFQVPSSYHQRGLFPLVVTLTEDPRANASNALRVQYAKRENPTIKK